MNEKIQKWYSELCFLAKVALCTFLFSLVISLLAYIGMQSEYISQIDKSNIDGKINRGFLYVLKFLFVNEQNRLNWVGISAIGVLISYWVTVKENAKKIDADLKAKARIEWIQNVRLIETDFVNNINLFLSYSASIIVIAEKTRTPFFGDHEKQLINERIQDSTNCLFKAKKEKTLLKLYFGTNIEDDELVGKSKELVDMMEKIYETNDEFLRLIENEDIACAKKKYDSVINLIGTVNEELEIFVLKARDYNKTEWDRAKQGE